MDSGIIGVLQFGLDGVSAQQSATANNLANAETPGFTASDVSFEQSLQQALSSSSPVTASIATTTDSATPASDGNNVDLGTQLIASQEETLHYSSLSEAINSQFRLIQGVAGGSFQ
jgi:flagellar basal-body rod protein FlgB